MVTWMPPLVEEGWWERDEAVVSAWTGSGRLHFAHQLYFGEAVSHPCRRPLHHPCWNENSQERPVWIWKVWWQWEPRHWQQAVLHQLVGHVLTVWSSEETPKWLRFAPSLHHNTCGCFEFAISFTDICLVGDFLIDAFVLQDLHDGIYGRSLHCLFPGHTMGWKPCFNGPAAHLVHMSKPFVNKK